MSAPRKLRKRLTYRAAGNVDLVAHALHWQGFTWQAGSTIVRCYGPFGSMQVWASSEAEGRRVIRHAANIAGWDLTTGEGVEWDIREASGNRNGRPGTMRTKETSLGVEVTSREGPNGTPGMA